MIRRRAYRAVLNALGRQSAVVVYEGEERYPVARGVEAIGLREMAALVAGG